jgi:hypothetical protein
MATKDFGDNGKRRSNAGASTATDGFDAPFRGYINLELTADEKDAFPAWVADGGLDPVVSAVVADGVNLSLKVDPKGTGFLASATQRRVSSVNAGLVVTARGKEPLVAWGRLIFTLAVLSRSERWEDTQPVANPDRW